MAGGGAEAETEEELSSRSSSGSDSEKWETSEEGRTKSKGKLLPDGFLDPLPPQKSLKRPRFSGMVEDACKQQQRRVKRCDALREEIMDPSTSEVHPSITNLRGLHRAAHPNEEMTEGSLFRRAKKATYRGGSSRGETSRESEIPSTPVHPDSQEEIKCSRTEHTLRHSFCGKAPAPEEGVWLIDEQENPIRHRGRTTCADIQNMPPRTRIHIEVNENNIPCNIPESILLGSYLGVVARDPILAPITFPDWRNKGMEPFKKKMLAKVESKFEFPGHIRHWILQSIGVKWRNYKTTLKAEHWNNRPIEKIMETVPTGVDQMQWCQLVTQKPEDQERAAKNSVSAKKQTCPHTMGRVSSVRRQKETAIKDRLQLWKINRMHKDGSWSSKDALQRWKQACNLLAEEGLTPKDGNIEANERVFSIVMGPEHSGRVRTQGFGVTPTRYFPQSRNEEGTGSGSNFAQIASLRAEFNSFRNEMRQVMQQFKMNQTSHGGSEMGGNDGSSDT